ncbi:MAG: ATP-binding protein [Luteolibacter sp.]
MDFGVLDVPTMSILASALSLLQAIAFGIVARLNSGVRGIGHWSAAALLNGFALPLLNLRANVDSVLLTRLLPTAFNHASSYFFCAGVICFFGRRRVHRWPLAVWLVFYTVFCSIILTNEGHRFRPIVAAVPFVAWLGLATMELLRERQPGLRFATRFLATAASVMGGMLVARAVYLLFHGNSHELLSNEAPHVAVFLSAILWALFWTFGAMMLINQRQTLDNLNSHAEQLRGTKELAAAEKRIMTMQSIMHREQLSRELHDGIGSITSHIAMLSYQGKNEPCATRRQEHFKNIEYLATEWNRELRLWMNGIERGSLMWVDVIKDMQNFGQRLCQCHDLILTWRQSGTAPTAPDANVQGLVSVTKIYKEALTNLIRHSDADSAKIHIAFRKNRLGLVIQDDGSGMDAAVCSGRGIRGMRRRVAALGGSMIIRGRVGTTICITLPLPLKSLPLKNHLPSAT